MPNIYSPPSTAVPAPTIIVIRVAVASPLRQYFDYLPPENYDNSSGQLHFGMRVLVPFGRQREMVGFVLEVVDGAASALPLAQLKRITQIIDTAPLWSVPLTELLRWISNYYHYPIGEVLQQVLPPVLRKKPNALSEASMAKVKIPRKNAKSAAAAQSAAAIAASALADTAIATLTAPTATTPVATTITAAPSATTAVAPPQIPFTLNAKQQHAIDAILNALNASVFHTFLVDGITGSGKTEVYLRVIACALEQQKQALVLVPEINLTPQTVSRFTARFPHVPIAIIHSKLNTNERLRNWEAARTGVARIVIGTRSAIFTPLAQPGIIIIDEEHDQSFKQQSSLRYSARDTAIMRGKLENIPVVLGSATPSLESFFNATNITNAANGFAVTNVATNDAATNRATKNSSNDSATTNTSAAPANSGNSAAPSPTPPSPTPSPARSTSPPPTPPHLSRYTHLTLPERAGGALHPKFHIIDMRSQKVTDGLAAGLVQAMEQHLDNNGQILLFLNSRGYAPILLCNSCGWTADCKNCDAHLTLHRATQKLHCHHCGAIYPIPQTCVQCGKKSLHALGLGTEKLEALLPRLFPGVTSVRVDSDTTSGKGAMDKMLASIHSGESQILIGTQMLSKGHHFPNVTLAAVLNVDNGLFSADFRASEHLAQMIVQVAGRAGRAERPGEVYIQTHHPHHPLLQRLIQQGYHSFARAALRERAEATLPPFSHLALLRVEARNKERALDFLAQVKAEGIKMMGTGIMAAGIKVEEIKMEKIKATGAGKEAQNGAVKILGPATSPMERKAGFHQAQLLFQSKNRVVLQILLQNIVKYAGELKMARNLKWSLDVDPVDMG